MGGYSLGGECFLPREFAEHGVTVAGAHREGAEKSLETPREFRDRYGYITYLMNQL